MQYSQHALERATRRIKEHVDPVWVNKVCNYAESMAKTCVGSSLALNLGACQFVGKAWANESNGDTVVAIIRDKKVITYMFRRSTQPFTPEALRVDLCCTVEMIS